MPRPDDDRGLAAVPSDLLQPVLAAGGSGRSGSTLLMALLGSSDAIAFDRVYPFETRYLTYLSQHALLLTGGWVDPDPELAPPPSTVARSLVDRATAKARRVAARLTHQPRKIHDQGEARGMPGCVRPLPSRPKSDVWLAGLTDHEMSVYDATLSSTWAIASPLIARGFLEVESSAPEFYAEKVGWRHAEHISSTLDCRVIVQVRDPRDMWASVMAFDEKRGTYGFGRAAWESEAEFRRRWIADHRRFFAWAEARRSRDDTLISRYEDLVDDLDVEARRIGDHVGTPLDPSKALDRAREHLDVHRSSPSVASSVGRFRRDLPEATCAEIEAGMTPYLASFGYT